MQLSLDTGSTVRRGKCSNCKSRLLKLTRFVLNNGDAYATVFAECHRHDEAEIFFTVILGTWSNDNAVDHVTFSCRHGDVEDSDEMACTLIDTPSTYNSPLTGKLLTRAEGLKHPRLDEFWKVVDYLVETDQTIHNHLYHPRPAWLSSLFSK